jgi:HAD superfamily hydrolase (TIGR01484 family)
MTTNRLQALEHFPTAAARSLRVLMTDIDDTLTSAGRLEAAPYAALERLAAAGIAVIPVTGRPAGWCDMIARFWPVAAVVGENGAFWYAYDHDVRRMTRHYALADEARAAGRTRLAALGRQILAAVPGARIAADQPFRETDLAIDFAEDVGPLPAADVDRIVALFTAAGAVAKVSSIHVNGWFGDFDKRTTALALLETRFALTAADIVATCAFAGDSPNDAPMFAHFPLSIGVANVRDFVARMATPPAFVTASRGGAGFVELADRLLALRAA